MRNCATCDEPIPSTNGKYYCACRDIYVYCYATEGHGCPWWTIRPELEESNEDLHVRRLPKERGLRKKV